MKEVVIIIPSKQTEILENLLEKYSIKPHNVFGEESREYILFVSDQKANELMKVLQTRGIGTVFGTVYVKDIDVIFSSQKDRSTLANSGIVSYAEILEGLEDSATLSPTFLLLTVLAGIIASIGLINDDIVSIIGAMIVAPLLGPLALTSLSLINPRKSKLKLALGAELIGLSLVVIVGFGVGLLLKGYRDFDPLPREMEIRTHVSLASIGLALVSGLAAGIFIVKGQGVSIVGVAIAAALCPPAANIGLLLALGMNTEATGTLLLLALNVFAVNFACSLVFYVTNVVGTSGLSQRQMGEGRRTNVAGIIMILSMLAVIVTMILTTDISR